MYASASSTCPQTRGSTSQSDCSTASLSLDFLIVVSSSAPGCSRDALWKTYLRRWWERRGFAARGYPRGSPHHSDLCAFGAPGLSGGCALHIALQQRSRRCPVIHSCSPPSAVDYRGASLFGGRGNYSRHGDRWLLSRSSRMAMIFLALIRSGKFIAVGT